MRNGRPLPILNRSYLNPATKKDISISYGHAYFPQETYPFYNARDTPSNQTVDRKSLREESAATERASKAKSTAGAIRVGTTITKPRHRLSKHDTFQNRIDKTLHIRKQAEKTAHSKKTFRKVYQEVRRDEKESWTPDWRVILGDLRKSTPQHAQWSDKAVSISVSQSAAETLLYGVDDNMWDIAEKYDCSVALALPAAMRREYHEFILSGSSLAISKTASEAMRIAPGSKLKNGQQAQISVHYALPTTEPINDADNEHSGGPTLRFVRPKARSTMRAGRVENLPKPSKWSIISFAEYVDQLTSMRIPNHRHHIMYKKGEEHVKTVSKTLREVFTDPNSKSSLSRAAFKKALEYFVKTSNIADARATFVLMDIMAIEMDPETFNILLRGAAKNEDLHNYHFILHLMLRRGITPNGGTWVAFLMANQDFRIKRYIMAELEAKGLLSHPAVLRRVCQELVIREVNNSLDNGQGQGDFLDHMDSRYGKDWLTVDNGNRVLHALGARNLISRCWRFLQAMDARFTKIDHVSINTILNHCKQQENLVGAIEILRLLPSLMAYEPDSLTYHVLFEMGWRRRSYNLLRVVWKYACLKSATTARMRMLVAQSLINTSISRGSDSLQPKRWTRQAGFVITNDVFKHPMAYLNSSSDKQNSGVGRVLSRKEAVQAVTRHLERDYKVFQSWKPARPFRDVLLEAWELDRKWQRERLRNEWCEQLDWKVQEAIPVPVVSFHRKLYKDITLEWR